jgi:PST family polysaccharide transporter
MNKRIVILSIDRNILTNFFSLSSLQILGYILPVIILPYLIRVIGPAKFGLIAFAQAFIQYFIILCDYSFNLSATREISINRENKARVNSIFSAVMTAKLFLVAFSFLVISLMVYFIPRFRQDWLLYLLSSGAVLGNALFPAWFFQGTEKMKYITLINIPGGLIFTACVFFFVRVQADYLMVPFLNSLYFIFTGFIGVFVAIRRFNLKFNLPAFKRVGTELNSGFSLFLSVVSINAYTATRVFAVGLLTNNVITGYYSIAERISGIVQTFPLASLSQVVYPRLSKIYYKSRKRALSLMYMIQDAVTSAYFLFIPLVIIIAPFIVRIVCGPAYHEVTITLRFLVFSVFFISANAFKVQYLLICGRQKAYSRIHIIAALVGLPLIFIMVSHFSYLGAALATIAIEAFVYLLTSEVLFYSISNKFKAIFSK